MRVAYLVNQYPKVSHSFIRREILALERQGIEVVRFAVRGWDEELVDQQDQREREQTTYVLRNGIAALLLPTLFTALARPAQFCRALLLAWRMGRRSERPWLVHMVYLAEACHLENLLRDTGVTHLHAHFGTNSAEVAMLAHEVGGPPWSFTVHGSELHDNATFIGLAEKIRRCTFAVAICSYLRAQIYRLIEHTQWHKVQVVHCGLEPAFHAGAAGGQATARRLVCVGRLSEEKGQLLLIDAAARLATQGEEFDLVLAGDGELRAAIETQIVKSGLQDRIRITGWISGIQVREEILAARALVLPSFAEGLPIVLMEAMALRRPVIASCIGGIPELVRHGQDGWLVPTGDVGALLHAMRAALNAPTTVLADMGEAAHIRALERHDVDVAACQLAKLFRTVNDYVDDRGPAPA